MAEKKMQLADWLDDLCVRFIVNLPQEELESVERICFQIEEAQWFYEDFVRPLDPSLPQLHLWEFASRILKHCPLTAGYSDDLHALAFNKFMAYKTRVPVRGAILLDHDMDKVLLVKGWKKNSTWSFPRGKINKDEDDLVCAIREVWEETGYDVQKAGLVPDDRNVHSIDVTMREQHLRMFVFRGVPLDTIFQPQTRKEISKIQFYRLSGLPSYSNNNNNNNKRRSQHIQESDNDPTVSANKLYMVAPFLPALKRWINQQRKQDALRLAPLALLPEHAALVSSDPALELDVHQPSSSSETPVLDPAHHLKRLLSVAQPPQHLPPVALVPEGNQANALLAMLRGSAGPLPHTPMEQVTAQPPEPQTPHYRHAHSSSEVVLHPPPDFPLSSARLHVQDAGLHMGGPNFAGSIPLPLSQAPPAPQQHSLSTGPQMLSYQHDLHQQPHHPLFQGQQQQAMPSLQPQGHGAIAHGPAAPKASQLPPPKLNNHTINLLNAFKSPALSRTMPVPDPVQHSPAHQHFQNQAPSYVHPAMSYPNGRGAPPGPQHPPAFAQQNMSSPMAANAAPISLHQNSLLSLFRSPGTEKSVPAGQVASQAPNQVQQRQSSVDARASQTPPVEPVKQNNTTVAMLTRTLPKSKAPSPAQLPLVGQQPGGETMFPAKQAVMEAQRESVGNLVPRGQIKAGRQDGVTPPMTILSRSGSRPDQTVANPASSQRGYTPETASPRRNGPPTALAESSATPSFTILQRPAQAKDLEPAMAPTGQSPNTLQVEESGPAQPFQPQLLRRPKTGAGETAAAHARTTSRGGDQRDTLLALFAKSSKAQIKGGEHGLMRPGSVSSGSQSPLPVDAAGFRSRIASNASALSNREADNGGLGSPATPIETKGFLLDYLNGVVKSEHSKGTKR